MNKLTIIINGKPGAGKDALCDAVVRQGRARKISSIDPIRGIAEREFGWDGVKDEKGRRLLSALKQAASEYNDMPNRFLISEYQKFMRSEDDILFLHIREKDQINAFRDAVRYGCITLLIRRPGTGGKTGNMSDDGVDSIAYDEIFDNDSPLPAAEKIFCNYTEYLLRNYA
jgi:hypothetical protein